MVAETEKELNECCTILFLQGYDKRNKFDLMDAFFQHPEKIPISEESSSILSPKNLIIIQTIYWKNRVLFMVSN